MTMTDGTSQAPEASAPAAGSGPEVQPNEPAAPQGGGGNPAWSELRSTLGDSHFKLIEPHLQKFDTAAQERITSLNSKLDQYTGLGEYEQLQQARALAQAIDNDPAAFYSQYGEFLRSQGLLEDGSDPQDEGEFDASESDDEDEDPRITELRQQQEALLEQFQQQEFEREVAAQSQFIDQRIGEVRQENPWMSDDDIQEVLVRAQEHINRGDAEDPIGAAATELNGLRQRYLSAPRPNDGAPKLIPTGGGNPASAQPTDVTKLGRSQTVDLVTQMLRAGQ